MPLKMYTNKSFASDHQYVVLQAKPKISLGGTRFLHFQIPGPEMNRDYGYTFDLPVTSSELWDELLNVFNKVNVDAEKVEEKPQPGPQEDGDEEQLETPFQEENDEQEDPETTKKIKAKAGELTITLEELIQKMGQWDEGTPEQDE